MILFIVFMKIIVEKKLEATEMYLNPASNAVMQVTKETLNHTISNVPMTFEVLKSQDGNNLQRSI